MMIHCREAARRSSELRDHPLSWRLRFELWYHLLICKFCKLYSKQIEWLGKFCCLAGKASSGTTDSIETPSDATLSEETKARIKERLQSR